MRAVPCRDYDRHHPDQWFPESPSGLNAAAALCAGCPIAEACLEVALSAEGGRGPDSRHGVFGGLTPKQRHAIARKNFPSRRAARTAAPTVGGDS